MWYNLTQLNATTPLQLVQSTNNIFLFGMFGPMLLLALFFILYRSFTFFNNNPRLNLMYSSFFIAVLAIFLRLMSLLTDWATFFSIALFAVFLILAFFFD